MDAEDLAVHDCRDGQVVEDVRQEVPRVGVAVLPVDLLVESILEGDLAGLVVATEEGDVLGELQLQQDEVLDRLHRVVSPVHEVAHEDVVGSWWFSSDTKQFEEVVELTMDISHDGYWSSDRCDV